MEEYIMYIILEKLNPVAYGIIGIILTILIISIVLLFSLRRKYKKLNNDINDVDNRESKIFANQVFNAMITDFKKAKDRKIDEINTQSIVEKNIHNHLSGSLFAERFIAKSVSLMIILGLIGTFFGLTLSISELVTLLSQASETIVGDVTSITGGLINAVRSMSVAFITSLFGIASSIIVTLFTMLFGVEDEREKLMVASEEYLDNTLAKKSIELNEITEDGRTPLEISIEQFGKDIEASLKEITSELGYKLTTTTNALEKASDSIEVSIDKFDQALDRFSENTRDFSEFNHHLKTNIERMSVTFDDLTEDLKNNNKHEHILKLSDSIEKLSDKVK
jgi:hypothetical protein